MLTMRKKYIWTIVILGVLALLGAYATYLFRDIPPFDDSNMSVSSIILKDEENAYFDLLAIEKTLYHPEEKTALIGEMARGEKWDQTFADELIAKNEEALKSFRSILTRKGYQDPTMQGDQGKFSYDMEMKSIGGIRNASSVALIEARTHALRGNVGESKRIIFLVARVGHLMQNSSRSHLLVYLTGTSIKTNALLALRDVSNRHVIFMDDSTKNFFASLDENTSALQDVFRAEYQVNKNLIANMNAELLEMVVAEQTDPLSFFLYFKPKETLRKFYNYNRAQVDILGLECASPEGARILQENLRQSRALSSSDKKSFFERNMLGEMFLSVALTSVSNIHEKRCENSFLVLQTQLTLALNAYKADNGVYPKNLEELAPKYMDTVPKEFAGRALEYDATTGRVSDMKDFYSTNEE